MIIVRRSGQVIPTPLHVLGRISPIFSPFFPVFCAFSPSRRGGSNEPQAGIQGQETAGKRPKRGDLPPSFDTPGAVGRITCLPRVPAIIVRTGPSAASAAKAAGEKALRLNPSHSYPPFLLYSLMGQMGAGDSEESGAMVSRAIRNHCHHGGGASAALQKRCKDHIMQGNLNLFV